MTTTATRRVQVERLAYGPHAVARSEGKVLFIRNAAPGEELEVAIQEDHGSYAYAEVVTRLKTSPERRVAPCPYLPRCGGCPWQHIDDATQLRAKHENIVDHMRRIAGLPDAPVRPILRSPQAYGYRGRLSMRTEARRLGFYAAASHDLVSVEHCLIANETLNAALPQTAALLEELQSAVRRVKLVEQRAASSRVCLLGEVEGPFKASDDEVVKRFLRADGALVGAVLHGKGWRQNWGDTQISISPEEGLELTAQVGAFTQVNPLANRLLVQQVLELGEFSISDRVLEIYAGIGNLSFPMARRSSKVIAIEQDRVATKAAQDNARRLRVDNIEVVSASAKQALSQWSRHRSDIDVVVVDPPRSGIADITDHLLELAPARLIYVSCDPSTLARDLKRLAPRYRVEVIQPIDLFPQTYHVEVVVKAVLTC